jgi:hypothetical protein
LNNPEGELVMSPMLYENLVQLDKSVHRKLRLKQAEADFSFAARINCVLLAEVEIVHASRDYPIAFASAADGKIVPVALLGLRENENLFVAGGKWRPNTYIPAYVRRYPFIPAETGREELAICIDEKYAGFDADSGEPLFEEDGEPAPLLKQAIELMQDYHAECKRTERLTRLLRDLSLLKEVSIGVEAKGVPPFTLAGLSVVDETKLSRLNVKYELADLYEGGHLPSSDGHLFSQVNLARLVDLLAERARAQEGEKTERSMKIGRAASTAAQVKSQEATVAA